MSENQGTTMEFLAKILRHSIADAGQELITFRLRYPRFIHSEVMTHREASRSASSSRAIPVMKMIKEVWTNPATPIHWGANQPGMQANSQLSGLKAKLARFIWRTSAKVACMFAYTLTKLGLHKQVANRILEPFQWINVVFTVTSMANIKALRLHRDAQPEFCHLVSLMMTEYRRSNPVHLNEGEWHLPYVELKDKYKAFEYLRMKKAPFGDNDVIQLLIKVSVARCARVSYELHDGAGEQSPIDKDLTLYERLVGSKPMHASPSEHQATPDQYHKGDDDSYAHWENEHLHGNLTGWQQHRKSLAGEYVSTL